VTVIAKPLRWTTLAWPIKVWAAGRRLSTATDKVWLFVANFMTNSEKPPRGNNLGRAYQGLGCWWDAAECHRQAIDIYREFSDRDRQAAALNNLGVDCQSLGRWQDAVLYHGQAAKIVQDSHRIDGELFYRLLDS